LELVVVHIFRRRNDQLFANHCWLSGTI